MGDWPLVGRSEELEVLRTALARPEGWGVVVSGSAGVGKSYLVERCVAAVEASGRQVARAMASSAAAAVPLGALVHLLPADLGRDASPSDQSDPSDPLTLFERAAAAFRAPAGGERLVLFVDDLHLLDPTSVVLLGQLLAAGVVVLVATVRTGGEPPPGPVSELWRGDRMARVDLGNLSRDDLETLLHLALGGPVGAGAAADLWAASHGNPLFVRELVLGARAAGTLVEHDGVWRLTGTLPTTPRLVDAIEARLPAPGGPGRDAVELLAVAEPVDVAELEDRIGPAALEDLERAGVVHVHTSQRRHHVMLAHPLYGEILRARLPALSRRRLLVDHAAWVERTGARRRDDPLRLAIARLDATGSADPDLLVAAARLARYGHDHARVVHLARAALAQEVTTEAQLLLGEALYEAGSYDEAEVVLAAAGPADGAGVDDRRHLVPVVATRVRNLLWGLNRPDEALAVNRAARASATSGEVHDELLADEGIILMISGRPADALAALAPLADASGLRVRVLRAIAEVPALLQIGKSETAVALARRGFADHVELGDQVAIAHPGIHLLNRASALIEAGQLDKATRLASACYEQAAREPSPIGRMWFALLLGRCALLGGQPVTARRWLGEAATLSREAKLVGPQRVTLAALATAVAWRGDAATAQGLVNELDSLPELGYMRAEQELGRAWALDAAGYPQQARDVLVAGADRAAEVGQHSAEARILHDLARLGDPAQAADRLDDLASRSEGALVAAFAAHARALARSDPQALADAGDRFESLGATLLAAEAASAAGHAYQRLGRRRAGNAAHTRAGALAAGCEGARTPGLRAVATVVPLTRREREIAMLASAGVTNGEIAQRLYVSVRTVHSHLHNAYTKLGVTNRQDLAAALEAAGAAETR